MSQSEPKQVIVVRKDLNMRKGKIAAQAAHASMGVILKLMRYDNIIKDEGLEYFVFESSRPAVTQWLNGRFTKVCVSVDSEQELLDIVKQAEDAGLPVVLITDAGLTEFNGVPTNTCCAIGPAYQEEINPITGHLKLF